MDAETKNICLEVSVYNLSGISEQSALHSNKKLRLATLGKTKNIWLDTHNDRYYSKYNKNSW